MNNILSNLKQKADIFMQKRGRIFLPDNFSEERTIQDNRILTGNRKLYRDEGNREFWKRLRFEFSELYGKWKQIIEKREGEVREYKYRSEGKVYIDRQGVLIMEEEGQGIEMEERRMKKSLGEMKSNIEELADWVKELSKDYIEGKIADKSRPSMSESIKRDKALTCLIGDFSGIKLIGVLNVIHGRLYEEKVEEIYNDRDCRVTVGRKEKGEDRYYVIKQEAGSRYSEYWINENRVPDSRDMIFEISDFMYRLFNH